MTSLTQPTEGASVGLSASVGFSLPILSKTDAIEQGLSFYFTGKSCKHGHIAKRDVRTSTCQECTKIAALAKYRRNREKIANGEMPPEQIEAARLATRANSDRWYKANPGYRRLTKYNLTEDKYSAMLSDQNSKCAICGSDDVLVVDHCHTNGHVRGLLCNQCNKGLGCFKDNVDALENAIDYLTRNTPMFATTKRVI